MVTQQQLENLKQLAQKAKPGDWKAEKNNHVDDRNNIAYEIISVPLEQEAGEEKDDNEGRTVTWEVVSVHFSNEVDQVKGGIYDKEDAEYIAAANPKVILEMIAKIEEQEAEIQRLSNNK